MEKTLYSAPQIEEIRVMHQEMLCGSPSGFGCNNMNGAGDDDANGDDLFE
ncbi:MAG: hypothetical protein KBS80_08155 [Bacteroidales bacterium]|nr:hypothetical protein [Candidatus Cryptobacteroides choladohippi]